MRHLIARTSPEERRRVLAALFGEDGQRRWHRFAILMFLSVVVAAMGLSLNSAAVVIGAMLLAPLMTPIMAFAASLCMGWPQRMATSGAAVILTSGAAIGLSWLLAKAQPALALTPEMLARTAPDGRDLAVALAAGTAGAYATAREDVSGALPGVAVAVALVPPLTTFGMMIELGRWDLAEGAGLLYTANLVAIVLVSAAVLLATGFVPVSRLSRVTPRVAVGIAAILAAAVSISVPLARQSFAFADRQEVLRDVHTAAADWLGAETSLEIEHIDLDGNRVTLDLAGPEAPPSGQQLAVELAGELGENVEIRVRWSQRSFGIERLGGEPEPPSGEEVGPDELAPIVVRWLEEGAGGEQADRLASIDTGAGEVVVAVVGPVSPPSAATLAEAIRDELRVELEVEVRWTEQRRYSSDAPPDARTLVRDAVRRWAAGFPGLLVATVELGEDEVIIDLVGESVPASVSELAQTVERELGRSVPVKVRFTERHVILDTGSP